MNLRDSNSAQLVFLPGALALALFFDGRNVEMLVLTVATLLFAMLGALLSGDRADISVPRHALPILLALYGTWLALTLLWSPVFIRRSGGCPCCRWPTGRRYCNPRPSGDGGT